MIGKRYALQNRYRISQQLPCPGFSVFLWSISYAIPFLLVASFLRVLPLDHSGQFCRLKQTPQCFCFNEYVSSRSFYNSTLEVRRFLILQLHTA